MQNGKKLTKSSVQMVTDMQKVAPGTNTLTQSYCGVQAFVCGVIYSKSPHWLKVGYAASGTRVTQRKHPETRDLDTPTSDTATPPSRCLRGKSRGMDVLGCCGAVLRQQLKIPCSRCCSQCGFRCCIYGAAALQQYRVV